VDDDDDEEEEEDNDDDDEAEYAETDEPNWNLEQIT